jgi:CRP-like cAMP-binding protein
MPASSGLQASEANRLLTALPEEEYERLLPTLEPVPLAVEQVLFKPHESIEHVHFIRSGVTSLVARVDDHTVVEIATVGNEGMVGLSVFLGAGANPVEAFVQIPGHAVRMRTDRFKEAVQSSRRLPDLMNRYTQALFMQIAQGAACNRVHSIEERCARWLLMTHDRVDADRFELTQEFLAQMLGVRRPTVNVAARMLQQAQLIRYSRGKITVLDRQGLESAACECYRIIRQEYDRLLDGK